MHSNSSSEDEETLRNNVLHKQKSKKMDYYALTRLKRRNLIIEKRCRSTWNHCTPDQNTQPRIYNRPLSNVTLSALNEPSSLTP